MIRRLIVLLSIAVTGTVSAGSGFYFLRTEKTPALISTAQTFYTFKTTIQNSDYNPASVFCEHIFESNLSYSSPDEDESVIDISTSYRDENVLYGLQISYMSITGLEGWEKPEDEPLYNFDSRSLIASFTYARKLFSGMSFGFTGKYLFEKIEFEDAYGFAVSAGLFRENNLVDGLSLGLALNNFGSMNKLENVETELPTDVLFGIGYSFAAWPDINIKLGNSSRFLINDDEFENFTGIELGYQEKFFVRSGYRQSNEGTPFSAGIGFTLNEFGFDYAYTPFSDESVNDSHSLSFSYNIK
jgi:hypothetical protein